MYIGQMLDRIRGFSKAFKGTVSEAILYKPLEKEFNENHRDILIQSATFEENTYPESDSFDIVYNFHPLK